MKTVKRKAPGTAGAPRRRKVTIRLEADPKLRETKPERPVGVPAPTHWLTLEEKQARAARLAKRHPRPALDPKLDPAALTYLRSAAASLAAAGWRRHREPGPGLTLAQAIAAGGTAAEPAWRAFFLIEEAIEAVLPMPASSLGRSRGVIWLNDYHATELGEVLQIVEAAIAALEPRAKRAAA